MLLRHRYPRRSELIAATHSLEDIQRFLDADSLAYLSLEGLLSAVAPNREAYCTSCYTGVYPVAVPENDRTYLRLTLKPADTPENDHVAP